MKEEDIQQHYMNFQMLDQEIKHTQKQLEMLEKQLLEIHVAKHTVKEIQGTKIGTEILVPISSGIFAKAELKDNSKVVLNVGANTTVSKDIVAASELIDSQIKQIKVVQFNLSKELEKLVSSAKVLGEKLQQMTGNSE